MNPAAPRRRRPRAHTGEQAAERSIFEATERLVGQQPLHELSVADIIKAAGVSRASFYHYFSDKYEVVAGLMSRIWGDIYSETHAELEEPWTDPAGALRSTLGRAMDTWSEHRSVINAVLENRDRVPALAQVWSEVSGRFGAVLEDQIGREQRNGRAGVDVAPGIIATILICGAERIFYVGSTSADRRLATPKRRLDAIVSIALAAIYGSPDGPNEALSATPNRATTRQGVDGARPSVPGNVRREDASARQSILEATGSLLQTTTFNDLTVAQILEASRVARGTFYFYFASKQDAVVALLSDAMTSVTESFGVLIGDPDVRRSPAYLRTAITDWLRFDSPRRAVIRNAIEEWPRRAEIREVYLAGHVRMVEALSRSIAEDRKAGTAVGGMPAAQLASGWLWTMERSWYESVGGSQHLADIPAVNDALAATLVGAIYGPNARRDSVPARRG